MNMQRRRADHVYRNDGPTPVRRPRRTTGPPKGGDADANGLVPCPTCGLRVHRARSANVELLSAHYPPDQSAPGLCPPVARRRVHGAWIAVYWTD